MKGKIAANLLISAAVLTAAIPAQYTCLPAVAFRAPVGALTASKKLTDGVFSSAENVSFSPFLLDMAKIIGRTGLSPGFFLQQDGTFPDQPGIDLRTLLLYQAGLLKMPVRLVPLPKHPSAEQVPTLKVPSLNQNTAVILPQPASDLPRLAADTLPPGPESTQVVAPGRKVGSPEKISLSGLDPGGQPYSAPLISFDVSGFQSQLMENSPGQEPSQTVSAAGRKLAMDVPRASITPFVTRSLFRLWTCRSRENAAAVPNFPPESGNSYEGTFVLTTPSVIKSINGRKFNLLPGRLLASNQGGELVFKTDLAEISLSPESTAVIDLSGRGVLKIFALESNDRQGVVVELKSAGKSRTVKLDAGYELLLADHDLCAADFAGSCLSSRDKIDNTAARGSFSINQFVDKEILLRTHPLPVTAEYVSALSQLKRRLSQAR